MLKLSRLMFATSLVVSAVLLSSVVANADVKKSGTITGSVVNLREKPSTSAKIMDKLSKGTNVEVLDTEGDWIKVIFEGSKGWISEDYISVKQVKSVKGVVTCQKLNIRTGSNTTSDSLGFLNKGDKVDIIGKASEWLKIVTEKGTRAWVCGDYISLSSNVSRGEDIPTVDAETGEVSNSDKCSSIVQYAKRFLGTPYVWGGTSPSGFDCSGFVRYVYRQFDVYLSRSSSEQTGNGTRVLKSDLQTGDLVFFDTNGGSNNINHVGIYIGSGRFIHASNPGDGVKISDLDEGYYLNSYMTARRVMN